MRIKELKFKNYRAFIDNSDVINILGKNVLIYGENGSGKSSIYHGLKEFFRAFDVTWTIEKTPRHLKADPESDYEVIVTFDNEEQNSFVFSGQTLTDETLGQTFLLNSFLSYKELLRTHFIEPDESLGQSLFSLLTQDILRNHELGDLTVQKYLEEILRLQTSRKADDKIRRDELLTNFNALFPIEIKKISEHCQKLLDYFDKGFSIALNPQPITVEKTYDKTGRSSWEINGTIGLAIKYLGIEAIDHIEILNEARLSALAVSIYLAAIATNPLAQSGNYKILCLDDIFIGLDTSNRLPLLEILKKFSLNDEKPFFENFQIIITTYDRYWFEIAKQKLGNSWGKIEMFVGEELNSDGMRICEKPVVIQESLGNAEKAKQYFEAFDYFSAGNWLRKALEEELNRLIPDTYRIEVSKLEGLIDKLFAYYQDCSCSDLVSHELKIELKTFRTSLLNPSSHFDLKHPLYKAEIEKSFVLINELKQIKRIQRELLIGMRSTIFYKDSSRQYQAEYVLQENVYAIKIDGLPAKVTDALHSLVSWSLAGTEFSAKNGEAMAEDKIQEVKAKIIKLSERPERIKDFLNLGALPDWMEFTDRDGRSLSQLVSEI